MISIVLHDIRSVYNTASIFRTADGAGVNKIYLGGYTPTPVDRFGRSRENFHKVALGAEESVEWEQIDDFFQLIEELREQEIQTVAVEQAPGALNYRDFTASQDTVFVFGNEVEGLPQAITDACDEVVEIPMLGQKKSLNVSVAVAVILYHFL